MRKAMVAAAVCAVLAIVGVGVRCVQVVQVERQHRTGCMSRLGSTGRGLIMYGMDEEGRFPRRMADARWIFPHHCLVLCPGSGTSPGEWTDVDQWMDYIYIPWSTTMEQTPTDYPVMYDRRMSHHRGKGIHVLQVDAAVFWDEGAKWLRRFAAEHPEYKITLPEGCEQ
jgi:hypothetical protein